MEQMKRRLIDWTRIASLPALLAASVSATAQDEATPAAAAEEEVVVIGVRGRLEQAGNLKDAIVRTEEISAGTLDSTRSVNLTEAMQDKPGVIVSNECSMCGYKRIQLNGLKAEHTSIMIDGLPAHTILSGFYAVDAIATTGVERIEIARGAGASLTAPEAIGGVVNVVTFESLENGFDIDLGTGEDGFQQIGLLGTLASESGDLRATFIGQFDERKQFDADGNGVSENPLLDNGVATARISWDATNSDNLNFRLSHVHQEMFGGPMLGDQTPSISAAIASESLGEAAQLFIGDDVRNRYIGNAWETTEWVDTERLETSASWLRELSNDWNVSLSASASSHVQNSFYEGFDYDADDDMLYLDARFNYSLNDNHHLTFGTDSRTEKMRSRSKAGELVNNDGDPTTNYVSDSFNYDVLGLYLQDTWTVSDSVEVQMALRADQVEADFVDPTKPGVEIDRSIVSPRLDMSYSHNDEWTSRFSVGRGYRAPLSFFETDHGILDAGVGFDIDINELERSLSTSYSLAHEGNAIISSFSITNTNVENLSTLDETEDGVPLLTQLSGDASVLAVDLAVGYQIADNFLVNFTASKFNHDDAFKSSFGVATMEEQANLNFDWDPEGWEVYASLSGVGSRNLLAYGYEGYNDAALTIPKSTNAPSFYWVDLRVARDLGDRTTFYVGANNLFDNTQAGDEDSPLMFDADGGYDVAYIYGLLRGREVYAGFMHSF